MTPRKRRNTVVTRPHEAADVTPTIDNVRDNFGRGELSSKPPTALAKLYIAGAVGGTSKPWLVVYSSQLRRKFNGFCGK